MKKLFAFALLALFSVSTWAVNLYLKSGTVDYPADNAVVAIWSWGGSSAGAWSTFKASETSGVYYAVLPEGRTSGKIMRWPSGTTPSWEAEGSAWNKTDDISFPSTYPSTTDMLELNDWNGATSGTWSKYVAPDPGIKFYITGDSALVVDQKLDKSKAWNSDAIASTADSYTLKGLKANVRYQMKVVTPGKAWKGYSDLTGTPAAGLYTYNGGNICFRLSAAGDVVVNYTSSAFTLSGSFKAVEYMTVKLVPGIWQTEDKPKFAAWTWGHNGYENWSPFFTGTGDTLSAQINADADSIIFVRCNPKLTEPKWNNEEEKDNVYNEAEKTEIDKVGLTYTITGWGEGEDPKSTGTWKSVANYYVTGDSALVVDQKLDKSKEWHTDAIPSYQDTLVLKDLKANQEYKMKVHTGSAWKGYSDLTSLSSGLSVDGDNNIIFKLTDKGDVTVVYNSEVFKVLGSFVEPAFDPATQEHLKLVPYRWKNDNAKIAVYTWGKKIEGKWSAFFTGEGDTLQTVIRQAADSMVLVRFNSDVMAPDWELEKQDNKVWNKIDKILIDHKGLVYTIKNWNEGTWESYAPPVPVEKTVKLVPSEEWLVANAKFAAYTWGKEMIEAQWTDFFTPVSSGNDTLLAKILSSADSIAFVRFSPKAKEPTWEQKDSTESLIWGELKDTIDWKGLTASIDGWNTLTWEPIKRPCESFGLTINGTYHAGKKNVLQTEWLEYKLLSVELTAGDSLQVRDDCNNASWAITKYATTSYEFEIKNNKYVVAESGKYDFYLKFIPDNDEVYISKHGHYTQSVPTQCEDVLMQAFFNESYNDKTIGVQDYQVKINDDYTETVTGLGNTKWTTLTAQADEIGHYFDLVWLPPSSYGSGMGYHPKKYSDQNSSWGYSGELDALIAALHNAGSQVIADVVINHCEGWTSWCDFPDLDFGTHGHFYPDESYICKNDEVNSEWNKDNAGSCYGKASGSYDDGENWEGARDWSHDNVYVQNMFKAYLKWLRSDMKYDGFRYDKGDGFDNWHHDNYNKASGPYIAFMECYSNTDEIWRRIQGANYNLMALDFDTKWHVFDQIAGWNYVGRGNGLMGRNNGRYAVEFIDSHDWFLRSDNSNEFGGNKNSLTSSLKSRLLQANAFLLSMPGVPCVFYPHWAKYKNYLKPMIEARKAAGIHSESEVKDEQWDWDYDRRCGYQATIVGKDGGYLILCLGTKAHQSGFDGFKLWASDYNENDCYQGKDASYQIWVKSRTIIPTSTDNVTEPAMKAEKFMKDGKMYIRLGDKVYDVIGQTIK